MLNILNMYKKISSFNLHNFTQQAELVSKVISRIDCFIFK